MRMWQSDASEFEFGEESGPKVWER